jgi:hypothetical protein
MYAHHAPSGLGWVYFRANDFPRVYSYSLNRWLYLHLPSSAPDRLIAWDASIRGWITIRP